MAKVKYGLFKVFCQGLCLVRFAFDVTIEGIEKDFNLGKSGLILWILDKN